jgi:type I restriction enzyme, S subunit
VRWGSFDLSDLLQMRMTTDELEAFAIKNGDLLVCEGGEPARAAVWRSGPTDLKFQKALHRVRPYVEISPDFLAFYLKYVSMTGEIQTKFTGTTIQHFPLVAIKNLQLPLPPASEQLRIVAKIDSLSAKSKRARDNLDRLTAEAPNSRKLIDHLDQAILAKAFHGELVPQAPDDEPASALLERIRVEQRARSLPLRKLSSNTPPQPQKLARRGRWKMKERA